MLSDAACNKYQDIYISATGKDVSACGSQENPCKTLTYALTEYQRTTGNLWLSCVRIHINSSQKLDGLNLTGLQGFGDPTKNRGEHTQIHVLYERTSFLLNDKPSISISGINFEHVQLSIEGVDTDIFNCTFNDSSLVIRNIDLLDIKNSNWTKTTNIALLDIKDTINTSMSNCGITDTVLEYSNYTKDAVLLENIKQLSVNQFTMTHSNLSINRQTYPDPEADILGLIKIVNSSNTHLVGMHIVHTILRYDQDNLTDTFVEGYGATLFLKDTEANIRLSTFSDTKGCAVTAKSCNLSISKSNFTNNTVQSFGNGSALASWDTQLHMDGCTFTSNNAGNAGAAIYLHGTTDPSAVSSTIHNCTFDNNNASVGGAVASRDTQLHIDGCTFTSNRALNWGGAVYLQATTDNSALYIKSTMRDCIFHNNTARSGGAVWLENTQLHMDGCNFTSNRARNYGGAVDCYGQLSFPFPQLIISNAKFHNNSAYYGVALKTNKCHTSLETVIIHAGAEQNTQDQLYIKSSDLTLTDVAMETNLPLATDNPLPLFLDTFVYINGEYSTRISYVRFNLTCPPDYLATLKNIAGPGKALDLAPCSNRQASCYDFIFTCKLVRGFYILGGSSLYAVNQSIYYRNNVLKPCPIPGGNCTHGLKPLTGFWGPYNANNGTAGFIKCAPELCCTGNDCKDNTSCNSQNNRAGILCTQCKTNYSESLFSETCVANERCNAIWPLVVVPILVILIVTLSVFFGVQKYVIALVLRSTRRFVGVVPVMFQSFHGARKAEPKNQPSTRGNQPSTSRNQPSTSSNQPSTSSNQPSTSSNQPSTSRNQPGTSRNQPSTSRNQPGTSRNQPSTSRNQPGTSNDANLVGQENSINSARPDKQIFPFILAVFTTFSYTQDVNLYHVDLAPSRPPWQKDLSKTVKSIFNLQAQLLGSIANETCVSTSMSPIGKIFLSISVYPLIYVTFLAIYIIVFKVIPLCRRKNICSNVNHKIILNSTQIKTNLATGFLLVAMLSYQNATRAALQLVRCVEVHHKVLLIDSRIKCYEPWQYLVWLYIATCSIPFPIYLIIRPNSLKTQSVSLKEFLVGLILPGPAIIWWLLKQIICKVRKQIEPTGEIPSNNVTVHPESGAINSSAEESINPESRAINSRVEDNESGVPQEIDDINGSTLGVPQEIDDINGSTLGVPQEIDDINGSTPEVPQEIDDISGRTPGVLQGIDDITGSTPRIPQDIDDISGSAPLLNAGNQHQYKDSNQLEVMLCRNLQRGNKMYLNGWVNWAGVMLLFRMTLVFLSQLVSDTLPRIVSMLTISTFSLVLHTAVQPSTKRVLNIFLILSQGAIVCVGTCYLILASFQRAKYQHLNQDPISSALMTVIFVFSVLIPASCVLIIAIDFVVRIMVALVLFLSKCICRFRASNSAVSLH